MQMPDMTRAQVAALAQGAIGVAVAFSAPISEQQSLALVALVTVVAAILIPADAAIRGNRAKNADKIGGAAPPVPPVGPEA